MNQDDARRRAETEEKAPQQQDGTGHGIRLDRRWFLAGLAGTAAGIVGLQQLVRAGRGAGTASQERSFRAVPDFPVRTVDDVPAETLEQWVITVDGMVTQELQIDYEAWRALPRFDQVVDFPCVEGWTVEDVRWGGVRPMDVIAMAGPRPGATHAVFHAYDGRYIDCLPFEQLEEQHSILADRLDGGPLPPQHGGPVRLVVPSQLAYKSVKFVRRIELTDHMVEGYWEERGYPADAPVEV